MIEEDNDLGVRSVEDAQWLLDLNLPSREFGGLSPREVVKGWLLGLAWAGVVGVGLARVLEPGERGLGRAHPRLVEFACPFGHLDPPRRRRVSRVRLLVNGYSGWVLLHQDSCSECRVEDIERWLITCPCCAGGDDPGHLTFYLGAYEGVPGDRSPFAHVASAMDILAEFVEAENEPLQSELVPEPEVTAGSVRDWLDELRDDDGVLLVPPTAGQTRAWELVREVPGHPPQALVREAQAIRKREA